MFAHPFSAPMHETLASHVFGRLMPPRAASVAPDAVIVSAPVQGAAVAEDDAIPDLAQRVREVGEW
jgi:hypothetical protein